jgi:hypothetical protein
VKFKKLFNKVYQENLKYWLMKWKKIIETRNNTLQKFDKAVLRKMRKRLYKEAFEKFKLKTERKA